MRRARSTVVAGVVGLALLAALVWTARPAGEGVPLDPRGTGPNGTAAMFELAERLGAEATVTATPPADASGQTIVVLADRFDDATRAQVAEATRGGARLVLFDPTSPLNPVPMAGQQVTDVFGAVTRGPSCPLLDGVADEVASARWALLDPGRQASAACYPSGDAAGLVVAPWGDGEVAVTGAVDALVNATIADASHAALAAALLAPEGDGRVTVVWDATLGGGDTALLDLLPAGVRRGFWVLAVAAIMYALARARRLGPPVAERMPVRVPASELALAIGDLLGAHRHRAAAAARLRADLRGEVARALQVPADTPPDVLVELLAARLQGEADADGLRAALLDGPVPDDAALVAVTSSLARVRSRLRRAGHGGAADTHE